MSSKKIFYSLTLTAIIFIIFIIMSCMENSHSRFQIMNPDNKNNYWIKHNNLTTFNTKIHSDGCSGGMSAIYKQMTFLHVKHGKTLQWRKCCEVHDRAYYYGGSNQEKKAADNKLNHCVTKVIGNKYLGQAIQIAVEIGGGPYLSTSYRWGYGVDFNN